MMSEFKMLKLCTVFVLEKDSKKSILATCRKKQSRFKQIPNIDISDDIIL